MKNKPVADSPVPMERTAEMRISVPPDKKALAKAISGLKMGKRVTFEVTGKITSMSMDSYHHSLQLEITALDCDPGMGGQVEGVRESRKAY